MFGLPATAWRRFAVWLVIGLGLYAAYGSRRSRLSRPRIGGRGGETEERGPREAQSQ